MRGLCSAVLCCGGVGWGGVWGVGCRGVPGALGSNLLPSPPPPTQQFTPAYRTLLPPVLPLPFFHSLPLPSPQWPHPSAQRALLRPCAHVAPAPARRPPLLPPPPPPSRSPTSNPDSRGSASDTLPLRRECERGMRKGIPPPGNPPLPPCMVSPPQPPPLLPCLSSERFHWAATKPVTAATQGPEAGPHRNSPGGRGKGGKPKRAESVRLSRRDKRPNSAVGGSEFPRDEENFCCYL